MHITWSKQNNEKLENWYNRGMGDDQMAREFNTTVFAVAKQRSLLGLVKFKKGTYTREEKTIIPIIECNCFIAHYKEGGTDHFINLGEEEAKAKNTAYKVCVEKRLKNITILKPYTRLVVQAVQEVKL